MIAKLIERLANGERAREIVIHGEEFLLGRGNDCDLRLSDVNISRHHCLIRIRPEEIMLVDLGSSNGSFVNGQRIVSQVALKAGDLIRLGENLFVFELGDGTRPDSHADVNPLAKTIKINDIRKSMKPTE